MSGHQAPKLLRRPQHKPSSAQSTVETPKWKIAQRPSTATPEAPSTSQQMTPTLRILKPEPRISVEREKSEVVARDELQAETSSPPVKILTKSAPKSLFPPPMYEAVKLIDENLEFADFCKEYIFDSNKKYTVIGAIGAQGTGKSSILSMLAGNEPSDRFRQYVFRPCSREACESCRFQTLNIWVYINKFRTIFLDCQGLGSTSIFEESIYKRRITSEMNDSVQHQLLTFLANVCHTILFCVDWFIDIAAIREFMRTELYSLKYGKAKKRTNIVLIHQRSKSTDFQPLLVKERMNILEGIFENSSFNIHGNLNMSSLGFKKYDVLNSDVNYVLLSDMRPRTRGDAPQADVISSRDKRTNVEEYADIVAALRIKILQLNRPSFSYAVDPATEAEWFSMAAHVWKKIRINLQPISTRDSSMRSDHHTKDLISSRRRGGPSRGFRDSFETRHSSSRSHTPKEYIPLTKEKLDSRSKTNAKEESAFSRRMEISEEEEEDKGSKKPSLKPSNELSDLKKLSLTDDNDSD